MHNVYVMWSDIVRRYYGEGWGGATARTLLSAVSTDMEGMGYGGKAQVHGCHKIMV